MAPTANPYNRSNNLDADDINSIQDKEIRDIATQIKGLDKLSSIDQIVIDHPEFNQTGMGTNQI